MNKTNEYYGYLNYLGKIPEFLYKYLDIPIMKRLKDITVLCGMNYASKNAYSFSFAPTRYDHSLGVSLITWRLTKDKTKTLAALFHDISTPVFSHVIDYMNGDFKNMESTEEKTEEILLSSKELIKCLNEDNININDIIDFKKYSEVDLDRPYMCADRLDGNIVGGFSWTNSLSLHEAIFIIDSIYLEKNENNQDEISFKNRMSALKLVEINDEINRLTHTKEDKYMMLLLANIVRRTIDLKLITYDDLYTLTEHEYMDIIKLSNDNELNKLWYEFKTISKFPEAIEISDIKNKNINPLVLGKRLY